MNCDSYRIAENVLFITGQHVTSTHQQNPWKKKNLTASKVNHCLADVKPAPADPAVPFQSM